MNKQNVDIPKNEKYRSQFLVCINKKYNFYNSSSLFPLQCFVSCNTRMLQYLFMPLLQIKPIIVIYKLVNWPSVPIACIFPSYTQVPRLSDHSTSNITSLKSSWKFSILLILTISMVLSLMKWTTAKVFFFPTENK